MPKVSVVDYSGCGGAGECIEACKFGVWGWADVEVRGKKRRLPAPLHQEKCVGCRACERACPMKIIRVED